MITLQERVHGTPPPADWQANKLRNILRVRKRAKNTGMQEDNLLSLSYGRIIRKDIDTNEGLLPESFETYQIVEPGNIVMRLTDLQNDKRSIRQGLVTERGIITSAYDALEIGNGHDPRFWAYTLLALDLAKYYYSLGAGVRQSIKFADFPNDWIRTPSLKTQKSIADFLDRETARIDQLIEKKQRLATLLQEQFIAFREYLLSNGAPMRLKFLAKFITSGSRDWGTLYSDDGELFIRIGNISGKGIDLDLSNKSFVQLGERSEGVRTKLKVGDLLLSITANLGSVAIVGPEAQGGYINQHVALVRLFDSKNARFIAHSLQTKRCRDQFAISGNGGTKQGLSLTDVKEVSILLPSVEEQAQRTFLLDARWSKVSRIYEKLHGSVAHLREHRSALITAAVTGQIDVATWGRKGQTGRRLEQNDKEMTGSEGTY
nr:restriction endonuclease subunit S [Brucella anthropi]